MMSECPTTGDRWVKKRKASSRAERMREAKWLKNKEEQQDNESETALQRQQADSEESQTVVPTPEASEVSIADSEEPTPEASEVSIADSEEPTPAPSEVPTPAVSEVPESLEEIDLEEDPDGDAEEEEEYTDPQEAFDDFMLTLTRNQRKMLSILLYESFRTRQQMSKMDAAQESASITGLFSFSVK